MHYVIEILSPLSEWNIFFALESDRKLVGHANNTQAYTTRFSVKFFEGNRMKTVPHPLCSTDIASSDFSLFGYVKRCLDSRSFLHAEKLVEAVPGVLNSIEKRTLQAVFLEWMNRLRKGVQPNSPCTEPAKKISQVRFFLIQ
jgi:hypothetical protein